MSRCRSCGAVIVWCRTQNDKRMPMDPEPVHEGNVVPQTHMDVVDGRLIDNAQVRVLGKKERLVGEPKFVSHFTTCPHGDSWSKKR